MVTHRLKSLSKSPKGRVPRAGSWLYTLVSFFLASGLLTLLVVWTSQVSAQTGSQAWELTIQFPGAPAYLHSLTVDSTGSFTGRRLNDSWRTDCTTGTYSIKGKFAGSSVSFEGWKPFSCLVDGRWQNYPIFDYGDGRANASFPNATTASGSGTARTWNLIGHLGTGKGYQSAQAITLGFSWTARLVSGAPTPTPTPSPTPSRGAWSPSPTACDFALVVTPSSHTVSVESLTSVFYDINVSGQANCAVYLEVSGIPPGAYSRYSVIFGVPPYSDRLQVTPGRNTPPGKYDITIKAYTAPWENVEKITRTKTVTLIVEEPFTFTITALKSLQSVNVGDEAEFSGEVTLRSGKAKEIELFVSGPDAEKLKKTGTLTLFPRFKLSPQGNPLGVPSFGWKLSVKTFPNTPPGRYQLHIGVGGFAPPVITLILEVIGFGIDITVQGGDSRTVKMDSTGYGEATYNLVIRRLRGKPELVRLFMAGKDAPYLFQSAEWDFDGKDSKSGFPDPVFITTLRIRTLPKTPPGIYQLAVEAQNYEGMLVYTKPITLEVPSFDFDVTVQGGEVRMVERGGEATYDLVIRRLTGSPQNVRLQVAGQDTALLFQTARWDFDGKLSKEGIPEPVFIATLRIRIFTETPPGIYRLTINAVSKAATRSKDVVLEISDRPVTVPISWTRIFWTRATPNSKITQGEVTTPEGGFVDIALGNRGQARIGPNSRVVFGPKARNLNANADLVVVKGKIQVYWKAEAAPAPPSFGGIAPGQIAPGGTPIGGIGIHYAGNNVRLSGTEILIEVADDGTGTLTVLEGITEVSRPEKPGETVAVKSGQQLSSRSELPLPKPARASRKLASTVPPLERPFPNSKLVRGTWWAEAPETSPAPQGFSCSAPTRASLNEAAAAKAGPLDFGLLLLGSVLAYLWHRRRQ